MFSYNTITDTKKYNKYFILKKISQKTCQKLIASEPGRCKSRSNV